jgi:hypothetical protein
MEAVMIRVFAFLAVLLAAPLTATPASALLGLTVAVPEREWSGARFCTREYRPVCARLPFNGRLRTFPNRCEARAAGARFVHPGPCRGRR